MSYSTKLKEEILNKKINDEKELISELLGIFLSKNAINNQGIFFQSENIKLVRRVYSSIISYTNIKPGIKFLTAKRFSKPKVYQIEIFNVIQNEDEYEKLLKSMFSLKTQIDDEKIAYNIVRGYFLHSGYIKDPNKGYSLDFFIDTDDAATFLYLLLKKLNKRVFVQEKKSKFVVYIRNFEDILDIINGMGGINTFFEFEDINISRSINKKVNNQMIFEMANEEKIIGTAIKQVDMINYIDEKIGIETLTPALYEIAKLRLENENESFQELAKIINISKSGIRNRFERIEKIYLELKGEI